MRHFLRQAQFFFRPSRPFFREAAFSSGGEEGEWRATRATVGESGDKAENEFTALSPLVVLRRASALTSPPPDFLLSSIPTQATKPHQIKQPLSKIAVNERTVGENCAFSHRVFWISAKNSNFVYHTIHLNLKIDYAQQNDSRRSARH